MEKLIPCNTEFLIKFIDFIDELVEKIRSSKIWTCKEYANITSKLLNRFNSDEIKSIKKENIVSLTIFKICPDDDLPVSYKNGISKGIDIAFGRS